MVKSSASGISISDVVSYAARHVTGLYHKNSGEIVELGAEVEGYYDGDGVYFNTCARAYAYYLIIRIGFVH